LDLMRKLLPPTGVAARFQDAALGVGTVDHEGVRAVCLLNWEDAPRTLSFAIDRPHRVRDLWSGEDLGHRAAGDISVTLPPRSGRVLTCTPAA
jgi:alpha-galactosidase